MKLKLFIMYTQSTTILAKHILLVYFQSLLGLELASWKGPLRSSHRSE